MPARSLAWLATACALASLAAAYLVVQSGLWIGLFWLGFCAAGVLAPGARARRLACLNAGFLLLVFVAAELVFARGPELRSEGSALEGYTIPHDVLGYAPAPGHETTLRVTGDGEVVYDVTYTIDAQGLRISPPSTAPDGGPCLVFFGDSFTFGEGLENDETLPWQLGVATGGRYRVYNFGFHGYGPHQMLAALERGLVEERTDCRPLAVVYQGAEFHVARAAGLSTWEESGPHYEASEDGGAKLVGRFAPDRFLYPQWLVDAAAHSRVLAKLRGLHRPTHAGDVARLLGILEQTRREVAERFPGAELLVVWWDSGPDDALAAELLARGFRVQRVSAMLPDRFEAPEKYRLHRLDGHPNALAFERVAAALAASFDRLPETSAAADPEQSDADPR